MKLPMVVVHNSPMEVQVVVVVEMVTISISAQQPPVREI
jgi:hypothetical protein